MPILLRVPLGVYTSEPADAVLAASLRLDALEPSEPSLALFVGPVGVVGVVDVEAMKPKSSDLRRIAEWRLCEASYIARRQLTSRKKTTGKNKQWKFRFEHEARGLKHLSRVAGVAASPPALPTKNGLS